MACFDQCLSSDFTSTNPCSGKGIAVACPITLPLGSRFCFHAPSSVTYENPTAVTICLHPSLSGVARVGAGTTRGGSSRCILHLGDALCPTPSFVDAFHASSRAFSDTVSHRTALVSPCDSCEMTRMPLLAKGGRETSTHWTVLGILSGTPWRLLPYGRTPPPVW